MIQLLRILDLTGNEIDNNGAEKLANALKTILSAN
ncbi:MAG: hypothetical protein HC820_05510 [Hydrococcus sp. RM1_1_31]|nr:hypothetical protein [Hydrococcus sp. RM1_1_31]